MRKITIITLIFISSISYGQINTNYKSACSEATKLILTKLDSLTSTSENNFVEFRVYGDNSAQSEKFNLYIKLYDTASISELLSIIENSFNPVARAYAYMAYAFHCDKEKIKENPLTNLNKKFFVRVQNGFNIQNDVIFSDFKSACRQGNRYNPHLEERLPNSEEPRSKKKRKG